MEDSQKTLKGQLDEIWQPVGDRLFAKPHRDLTKKSLDIMVERIEALEEKLL